MRLDDAQISLYALAVETHAAIAGMEAHNRIAEQNGTGMYDEDAFTEASQELTDALQSHRAAEPRYTREQVERLLAWCADRAIRYYCEHDSAPVTCAVLDALRTLDGEGAPDES